MLRTNSVQVKNIIKTLPFFLYGLSFFFVLHGFTENFGIVPPADAFLLFLKYSGFSVILAFLFWILYKNFTKASLVVFFIMAYNFFFGKLHDISKIIFKNSFVIKYSFILPATIVLLVLLILYLKKTDKPFTLTTKYLNWLFIILILLDAGNLTLKIIKNDNRSIENRAGFTDCNTCPKPDIYLIMADEYAGQTELQHIFNFDNTPFFTELEKRGFHVVSNSLANYNFTQYSVASLFNMSYLTEFSGNPYSQDELAKTLAILKENRILHYLLSQGYSFYNYSMFDFTGHPSPVSPTFIPLKNILITSQTFTNRIRRDVGFHLVTRFKTKKVFSNFYYTDLNNNNKLYELTKSIASKKSKHPKFVYTHLVMPHFHYYFDKKGEPTPLEKIMDNYYSRNKTAYIEYLQYANEKLLALIDHIKKSAEKPPIILLMSDHGYRQFNKGEQVDSKYYFMNINSILIPGNNYSGFYDGLSNVNQFRVLLNSQFNLHLPLLKDSVSFLQ